jgi:hypothetical protein
MQSPFDHQEAGELDVEAVPLTKRTAVDASGLETSADVPQEAFATVRAAGRPLAKMAVPVLFTYLANFVLPVTSVSYLIVS